MLRVKWSPFPVELQLQTCSLGHCVSADLSYRLCMATAKRVQIMAELLTPPSAASPLEERVQRVREEYRDTPSLRLTPSQAQHMFGLRPSTWIEVLDALLTENFLSRTTDGFFVRTVSPTQLEAERLIVTEG